MLIENSLVIEQNEGDRVIPGLTDLEVDYGYNTEEDSIFQSFV